MSNLKEGDRVRFHVLLGKDTMSFVELDYLNKSGTIVEETGDGIPLVRWDDKTLNGPLYVEEIRLRKIDV